MSSSGFTQDNAASRPPRLPSIRTLFHDELSTSPVQTAHPDRHSYHPESYHAAGPSRSGWHHSSGQQAISSPPLPPMSLPLRSYHHPESIPRPYAFSPPQIPSRPYTLPPPPYPQAPSGYSAQAYSHDIYRPYQPVPSSYVTSPGTSDVLPGQFWNTHHTGVDYSDPQAGGRYECEYCQRRFSRPSSLRIHLNTHTGEKPFQCPYPGCGRAFSVQSNMRRHYRIHQQASASSASSALSPADDESALSESGEDSPSPVEESVRYHAHARRPRPSSGGD